MLNGLSRYSKSGASIAIKYFLSDSWKGNNRTPPPVTLIGNPFLIQSICESNSFSHKYTSGVLSFTKEETLLFDSAPNLKWEIIKEFENFVYAGIDEECRSYLAVEHRHTGRLEIHYIIPRVHLATGRYFNPFPPGYQMANDSFIDFMCQKYGLINPRSPERSRHLRVTANDPASTIKNKLHNLIIEQIENGRLNNAQDIRELLSNAGLQITRQGENYISVLLPGRHKAIRMKGEVYDRQFSVSSLTERYTSKRCSRESDIGSAEERYISTLNKRHSFNAKRFKAKHKQPTEDISEAIRESKITENCRSLDSSIKNFSQILAATDSNTLLHLRSCLNRIGKIEFDKLKMPREAHREKPLFNLTINLIESILSFIGLKFNEFTKDTTEIKFATDIVLQIIDEVSQAKYQHKRIGYALNNNNEAIYDHHLQTNKTISIKNPSFAGVEP